MVETQIAPLKEIWHSKTTDKRTELRLVKILKQQFDNVRVFFVDKKKLFDIAFM